MYFNSSEVFTHSEPIAACGVHVVIMIKNRPQKGASIDLNTQVPKELFTYIQLEHVYRVINDHPGFIEVAVQCARSVGSVAYLDAEVLRHTSLDYIAQ